VDAFGGTVPSDLASLESLPGVGPYTARAVAALAFGTPVGAVDTNVRRVLGRIVVGGGGALSAEAMQRLADEVVPDDRPGEWTHAVMDVGATVCRPRRPGCADCPARPWCRYAAAGGIEETRRQPVGARAARVPFRSTSRWLRGRIVDRLREVPNGCWVELDQDIGTHRRPAVESAVRALADDGLVELDGDVARLRARLPVAPA
jgi:A/G-specific adenine glycosylase